MSMKAQPEGTRRVARAWPPPLEEGGRKPPPSEYDIFYEMNNEEWKIGWTERLPKGMWAAHPAKEAGEVPPFSDHTGAVEFLKTAWDGHFATSEEVLAEEKQETEAILADADTMAAISEAMAEGGGFQGESLPPSPNTEHHTGPLPVVVFTPPVGTDPPEYEPPEPPDPDSDDWDV